jgi:hypothetical protein
MRSGFCGSIVRMFHRKSLGVVFSALMRGVFEAEDLILCLDGLGELLRTEGGPSNRSLLRQVLRDPRLQFIGILSQWDFDELLAGDAGVLDLCTIVRVPEPEEELSLSIVRQTRSATRN